MTATGEVFPFQIWHFTDVCVIIIKTETTIKGTEIPMNALNGYEIELVHKIHDALHCSFMDFTMPLITYLSNYGIFWILLAAFFLCKKNSRSIGLTMGIALILGLLTGNLILKPLTARIRPYDFDASISLLIAPELEFSFPSGHTLAAFEGAFSIFFYRKKQGIPALILAALTAVSRIYLQVHYPLDVICGALLGSLFALLAFWIVKTVYKKAQIEF